MRIDRLIIAIALPGLAHTAASAPEASATSASHPCATLFEDASRLECYDETFGRPNRARPPAPPDVAAVTATAPSALAPQPAAPAAAPIAASRDLVSDFGLTREQQRAQIPGSVPDPGPSSIEATVAQVRRSADGQFVVVLENGHVWAQNDPAVRVYLQPGEQVTIRKGALGSHLLVSVERGSVRVRRLK
jgi:hypothetical protein